MDFSEKSRKFLKEIDAEITTLEKKLPVPSLSLIPSSQPESELEAERNEYRKITGRLILLKGMKRHVLSLASYLQGMDDEMKTRQLNLANKRHSENQKSREFCIAEADKQWKKEKATHREVTRIGDMAIKLSFDLESNAMYFPQDKTIKNWLKKAREDGELYMPEEASKPGTPKVN